MSNASASIFIKMAVQSNSQKSNSLMLIGLIGNLQFWYGLIFYGCAFLLYSAALARLPLNVVHPVMTSGAIVVVALSSIVLFHESFNWTNVIGLLLILSGVILITVRVA